MLSEVAHPLLRFIIYIFEEEDDLKAKIGSPYERLKAKEAIVFIVTRRGLQ